MIWVLPRMIHSDAMSNLCSVILFFLCVCVCGMRQPAHSIFLRVSVGAEVAGSRAGELPKAEYTFFLLFFFFS